jgi:hypothetical protein
VNRSFDYLYTIIPTCRDRGLRDYYFSNDMEEVYLLWE